ncbi:Centrosomal protein [Liparis tanakae]|uniref:Centrosomal protein n=1 Tax=Liparis tanakae TaxID=230148 RepID=A0A4Z2GFR4_9TELE|nr:Centrosomal protein [Liparis tanakae]
MQHSDAFEKNKQWLEYDQQREAYVRATLARMLWLEKQLNEANQAHSQQHNEDHSDEMEKIGQMQEHYERLLQKAKDELEVLRGKFNMTDQKLKITQKWCKERESEVEVLKQQLQFEMMSKTSALGEGHCSEDEEQWLSAESENLQCRLDKERRKSADIQLQKFSLNCHHVDQEKIAELERQREQQDSASCEAAPLHPGESLTRSPPSSSISSLNESFLECPSCQAEYPASHYRELMSHLETCCD